MAVEGQGILTGYTVNDDLLNRAVTHQVRIQQYAEGQAEKMTNLLAASEPEIAEKLAGRLAKIKAQGFDRGPWTTAHLQEMLGGFEEITTSRYTQAHKALQGEMLHFADAEAKVQVAHLADVTKGLGLETTLPSPQLLHSMVTTSAIEGKVMGQWFNKLAADEQAAIRGAERSLALGLAQGETVEQLTDRVMGKAGALMGPRRNAAALTRTTVNHVSNHAREEGYRANADLIKGVKIVATLDGRTTPICRDQDGKVYPIGEGPRPPLHWNCRSTTAPVLKSWQELGIPLTDIPAGTRASMNGQVPSDLKWPDWFKQQPQAFQREVLGPSRYRLFAAGADDVTAFATPAGKLYTLEQLYKRMPDIAAKAGLISVEQAAQNATYAVVTAAAEAVATAQAGIAQPWTGAQWKEYDAARRKAIEATTKISAELTAAGVPMPRVIAVLEPLEQTLSEVDKLWVATIDALTPDEMRAILKASHVKQWKWATPEQMHDLLVGYATMDEYYAMVKPALEAWKAETKALIAKGKAQQVFDDFAAAKVAEVDQAVQNVVAVQDPEQWIAFTASKAAAQDAVDGAFSEILAASKIEGATLSPGIGDALHVLADKVTVALDTWVAKLQALPVSQLKAIGKKTGLKHWAHGSKAQLVGVMSGNADAAAEIEDAYVAYLQKKAAKAQAAKAAKAAAATARAEITIEQAAKIHFAQKAELLAHWSSAASEAQVGAAAAEYVALYGGDLNGAKLWFQGYIAGDKFLADIAEEAVDAWVVAASKIPVVGTGLVGTAGAGVPIADLFAAQKAALLGIQPQAAAVTVGAAAPLPGAAAVTASPLTMVDVQQLYTSDKIAMLKSWAVGASDDEIKAVVADWSVAINAKPGTTATQKWVDEFIGGMSGVKADVMASQLATDVLDNLILAAAGHPNSNMIAGWAGKLTAAKIEWLNDVLDASKMPAAAASGTLTLEQAAQLDIFDKKKLVDTWMANASGQQLEDLAQDWAQQTGFIPLTHFEWLQGYKAGQHAIGSIAGSELDMLVYAMQNVPTHGVGAAAKAYLADVSVSWPQAKEWLVNSIDQELFDHAGAMVKGQAAHVLADQQQTYYMLKEAQALVQAEKAAAAAGNVADWTDDAVTAYFKGLDDDGIGEIAYALAPELNAALDQVLGANEWHQWMKTLPNDWSAWGSAAKEKVVTYLAQTVGKPPKISASFVAPSTVWSADEVQAYILAHGQDELDAITDAIAYGMDTAAHTAGVTQAKWKELATDWVEGVLTGKGSPVPNWHETIKPGVLFGFEAKMAKTPISAYAAAPAEMTVAEVESAIHAMAEHDYEALCINIYADGAWPYAKDTWKDIKITLAPLKGGSMQLAEYHVDTAQAVVNALAAMKGKLPASPFGEAEAFLASASGADLTALAKNIEQAATWPTVNNVVQDWVAIEAELVDIATGKKKISGLILNDKKSAILKAVAKVQHPAASAAATAAAVPSAPVVTVAEADSYIYGMKHGKTTLLAKKIEMEGWWPYPGEDWVAIEGQLSSIATGQTQVAKLGVEKQKAILNAVAAMKYPKAATKAPAVAAAPGVTAADANVYIYDRAAPGKTALLAKKIEAEGWWPHSGEDWVAIEKKLSAIAAGQTHVAKLAVAEQQAVLNAVAAVQAAKATAAAPAVALLDEAAVNAAVAAMPDANIAALAAKLHQSGWPVPTTDPLGIEDILQKYKAGAFSLSAMGPQVEAAVTKAVSEMVAAVPAATAQKAAGLLAQLDADADAFIAALDDKGLEALAKEVGWGTAYPLKSNIGDLTYKSVLGELKKIKAGQASVGAQISTNATAAYHEAISKLKKTTSAGQYAAAPWTTADLQVWVAGAPQAELEALAEELANYHKSLQWTKEKALQWLGQLKTYKKQANTLKPAVQGHLLKAAGSANAKGGISKPPAYVPSKAAKAATGQVAAAKAAAPPIFQTPSAATIQAAQKAGAGISPATGLPAPKKLTKADKQTVLAYLTDLSIKAHPYAGQQLPPFWVEMEADIKAHLAAHPIPGPVGGNHAKLASWSNAQNIAQIGDATHPILDVIGHLLSTKKYAALEALSPPPLLGAAAKAAAKAAKPGKWTTANIHEYIDAATPQDLAAIQPQLEQALLKIPQVAANLMPDGSLPYFLRPELLTYAKQFNLHGVINKTDGNLWQVLVDYLNATNVPGPPALKPLGKAKLQLWLATADDASFQAAKQAAHAAMLKHKYSVDFPDLWNDIAAGHQATIAWCKDATAIWKASLSPSELAALSAEQLDAIELWTTNPGKYGPHVPQKARDFIEHHLFNNGYKPAWLGPMASEFDSMSAADFASYITWHHENAVPIWQMKQAVAKLFPAAKKAAVSSVAATPKGTVLAAKPGPVATVTPGQKPPAPPVGVHAQWAAIDAEWAANTPTFTRGPAMNVGGAHPKFEMTDPNGVKWMFKPQPTGKPWAAHAEEVAYKVQRLVDPFTAEVRYIEIGNEGGSIQRWLTDVDGDFNGIDPTSLTAEQLAQIQRDHVVNWMVANHDGHWQQYLRMKDGRVVCIDKGQALKFLGDDELSLDFDPNAKYGERAPYVNFIGKAAKAGKIKLDPRAVLPAIRAMEQLDDNLYRSWLQPYAEGRFAKAIDREAFIQKCLARKHSLRADFEAYYRDILGDPTLSLADIPKPTRVMSADAGAEFAAVAVDAERAGYQGRSLPFDGGDVEDQNALVFIDHTSAGPRTNVHLALREEASTRAYDWIDQRVSAVTTGAASVKVSTRAAGWAMPEDEFYSDILGATKTVNGHITKGDTNWNQAKIDAAFGHTPKLEALAQSPDPEVVAMAEKYLEQLHDIQSAMTTSTKLGKFDQVVAATDLPPAVPGQMLPQDHYAGILEQAVDAVNARIAGDPLDDGVMMQWDALKADLVKLARSPDPQVAAMAKLYAGTSDQIDQAMAIIAAGQGGPGVLSIPKIAPPTRYLAVDAQAASTSTGIAPGVQVIKEDLRVRKRLAQDDGTIRAEQDVVTVQDALGGALSAQHVKGTQYRVVYSDGMEIIVRPYQHEVPWAMQGQVEIAAAGQPTPQLLQTAANRLAEMGVDARVATAEDSELMYLKVMAHQLKKKHLKSWQTVTADLEARQASPTEQITALRTWWSRELKVPDVTQLPGYNPHGQYDTSFVAYTKRNGDISPAGPRRFYRFDISDDDVRREMADYALLHNVTFSHDSDGDLIRFFRDSGVLQRNGAIMGTAEKMRAGVPHGGVSVSSDMERGGATYAFFRIWKRNTGRRGIYFKSRNLRRTDTLSFHDDSFGDTGGYTSVDDVYKRRQTTFREWQTAANVGDNETNFKGSLSILDELDHIRVDSASAKQQIIQAFHDAGIDRLPDGRSIDDVVVTRGQSYDEPGV